MRKEDEIVGGAHPFATSRMTPAEIAAHHGVVPGGRALKDPKWFSYDRNAQPIYQDERQDLLAGNTPLVAPGKYVIAQYRVPPRMVLAVKSFVPYAMQRINVGAADESFQMINPIDGNGWFLFEPQVNDAAAFKVETNYNAAQTAAATNNDKLRNRGRGVSFISLNPWEEANRQWANPLFSFFVSSTQTLRVIFSILPVATTLPLGVDGRYTVGLASEKRVDFAGCVITGQLLPAQFYADLMGRVQKGEP